MLKGKTKIKSPCEVKVTIRIGCYIKTRNLAESCTDRYRNDKRKKKDTEHQSRRFNRSLRKKKRKTQKVFIKIITQENFPEQKATLVYISSCPIEI